jgi:hypothetical protein
MNTADFETSKEKIQSFLDHNAFLIHELLFTGLVGTNKLGDMVIPKDLDFTIKDIHVMVNNKPNTVFITHLGTKVKWHHGWLFFSEKENKWLRF